MIHLHRGPTVETLSMGLRPDVDTGELVPARVTVRRTICETCGRLVVVTTRDGRRWRRVYRPAAWTPPTDPAAHWPGTEPGADA